jgi:hypothetical protein
MTDREHWARAQRLADLQPGMIGFGPIHGLVGAGVGIGQALLGEGFKVGGLDIRHVRIVVEAQTWAAETTNGPIAVEAMPSGARRILLTRANSWTDEWAWVQLPEDYWNQSRDAAYLANAMVGTPYSPLSYGALAAWHWGVHTPHLEGWINRRKAGKPLLLPSGRQATAGLPREAICSVLADQAWSLTGKKIIQGAAPQVVTPGALAGRLLKLDGAVWSFPS